MEFMNYEMVGLELDKAFNAHRTKQEKNKGMCAWCMACAHDVTRHEEHLEEEWKSTKEDFWESCERQNWVWHQAQIE